MNLPAFPKPLTRLIAALPSYPASRVFVGLGNLVAWPGLRDQDWTAGRRSGACASGPGPRPAGLLLPRPGRLPCRELPASPATTFTATARDLARLALRLEDPDTLFFDRRLRIEGDTDLGLRIKNMLDAVDLDVAAAAMPLRLGSLVMTLRQWAMPL